jgi:hypothetical protein
VTGTSLDLMLVLNIPREEIEADHPFAERQLEISPGGWTGLGRLGKQLRFSGDRHGLELLVQAAETYLSLSGESSPTALMEPANILRLAGDDARATELFARMYRGIHEYGPEGDPQDKIYLVEACFFLGRDEEAIDTSAALQGKRPRAAAGKGLRHPVVADLAAARLAADPAKCQPVIDHFDAGIKRERRTTSPFFAGVPTLYDWLEIALILQSELSGQPSPRLREI